MLFALSVFADRTWIAGNPELADLANVLRIAIYWFWCRWAWLTVEPRFAPVIRTVLAAGFVTVVFTS